MKNRVSRANQLQLLRCLHGITSINLQAQDLAQTQEESIVAAMQVQQQLQTNKGISEFIRRHCR